MRLRGDERSDEGMDGRTEFLPILQDFVPSRRRCPATLCDLKTAKKQGKGTADHMMPLGDWFLYLSSFPSSYSSSAAHQHQLSSLSLLLPLLFPRSFCPILHPLFFFLGSHPNRGQSLVQEGETASSQTSQAPLTCIWTSLTSPWTP